MPTELDTLDTMPAVLEAYVTTGSSDVLCRLAASSHEELQQALLTLDRSEHVSRSTSIVVLSTAGHARQLHRRRLRGSGPEAGSTPSGFCAASGVSTPLTEEPGRATDGGPGKEHRWPRSRGRPRRRATPAGCAA